MEKLKREVRNEFQAMGISKRYLGERFLVQALLLLRENETRLCCVSKHIYMDIASCYHTSPVCVERNLRTLTTAIWTSGKREHLDKHAGYHLEDKPSNVEFLDIMSVYFNH